MITIGIPRLKMDSIGYFDEGKYGKIKANNNPKEAIQFSVKTNFFNSLV